jgi:hypothetical protein
MGVRLWVAGNFSTPPGTLIKLLQDPEVAEVVVDNPNLPAATRAMWQLTTQ